jgi:predicted DNA-binding protein (UPF0251 family)
MVATVRGGAYIVHMHKTGAAMPRRRKRRRCRHLDDRLVYKPRAVPFEDLEVAVIGLDAFEALRLCDLEGHDQTAAGVAMGVSRGTVQRLLKEGRRTLVAALLHRRALIVQNRERDTS